jgi:GMP synthase (glutamine-hydrolysing)
VWGVQWHPEVDAQMFAEWADEGGLAPGERERVLDEVVRSAHDLEKWWRPLAERLVELVGSARSARAG